MCDQWMPVVRLPLNLAEFHRLPRHAAYRYEYLGQQAHLTPRPKFYHAVLDLEDFDADLPRQGVRLRTIEPSDIPELVAIFAAAFASQQPFASLDEEQRLEASRQSLQRVLTGVDGPLIPQASCLAIADNRVAGAIFTTLLPDEDPDEWESYYWREPPPDNALQLGLGRPHITWIFVSPWQAGAGIGTALLNEAIRAVRTLGYRQLASTFMLGNDSSMLWHWRNGFQLRPYPASRRRLERLFQKRESLTSS